jgi:hypothetical protein
MRIGLTLFASGQRLSVAPLHLPHETRARPGLVAIQIYLYLDRVACRRAGGRAIARRTHFYDSPIEPGEAIVFARYPDCGHAKQAWGRVGPKNFSFCFSTRSGAARCKAPCGVIGSSLRARGRQHIVM